MNSNIAHLLGNARERILLIKDVYYTQCSLPCHAELMLKGFSIDMSNYENSLYQRAR